MRHLSRTVSENHHVDVRALPDAELRYPADFLPGPVKPTLIGYIAGQKAREIIAPRSVPPPLRQLGTAKVEDS